MRQAHKTDILTPVGVFYNTVHRCYNVKTIFYSYSVGNSRYSRRFSTKIIMYGTINANLQSTRCCKIDFGLRTRLFAPKLVCDRTKTTLFGSWLLILPNTFVTPTT